MITISNYFSLNKPPMLLDSIKTLQEQFDTSIPKPQVGKYIQF